MRLFIFIDQFHGCLEHCPHLHLCYLRICYAKTDTPVTHHRIGLMQDLTPSFNIFFLYPKRFCKFFHFFLVLWYKFMERRIEKPESNRQSVHSLERCLHVFLDILEKFIKSFAAFGFVSTEDHFAEEEQRLFRSFSVEHMRCTEKSYAFSPEIACNFSVGRCVGVSSYSHLAMFIDDIHELLEPRIFRCIHQFYSSGIDISFCAVQGKKITFLNYKVSSAYLCCFCICIHMKGTGSDDTAFTPSAGHECSM